MSLEYERCFDSLEADELHAIAKGSGGKLKWTSIFKKAGYKDYRTPQSIVNFMILLMAFRAPTRLMDSVKDVCNSRLKSANVYSCFSEFPEPRVATILEYLWSQKSGMSVEDLETKKLRFFVGKSSPSEKFALAFPE